MKLRNASALIAGTSLLAVAATPAFAEVIDGINVPSGEGVEHVFAGTLSENTTTTVGDELTGSGDINTFDGSTDFCATAGCSLSYEFSGYTLTDITLPSESDTNTGMANFNGGVVNFYANGDTDNPWLTLSADREVDSPYTLEGTLVNANTDQAQNTAVGLLSVTGGTAASFFDNDTYNNGDGGMSDLLFNTSLSPQGDMVFTGSADAHYVKPGTTTPPNVPEPGALAMLGLGLALVGFGATYRRRKDNC